MKPYSSRSATVGSIDAARRAGTHADTVAICFFSLIGFRHQAIEVTPDVRRLSRRMGKRYGLIKSDLGVSCAPELHQQAAFEAKEMKIA